MDLNGATKQEENYPEVRDLENQIKEQKLQIKGDKEMHMNLHNGQMNGDKEMEMINQEKAQMKLDLIKHKENKKGKQQIKTDFMNGNLEESPKSPVEMNGEGRIEEINQEIINQVKHPVDSSSPFMEDGIRKRIKLETPVDNDVKWEVVKSDLLHWKDMPQHLQFNPYIFTGYRPLLSIWGCINSLFYIHNETINIITHAVPIVYILLTVPSLMPWDTEFRFLSWCHLVGSVAPWIGSFVYHLFMNLERGENIYYRLLQLDMLGIWISQSFGAMPMVTASVYCLPTILRWSCITSYCVLSLWGLYKAMTAWSPWERRLCFLLPFSMRMVLCCLRVSSFGGGDPASLTHVFLQDAVSVVGAAIGAMHIPEKWFPGTVDLYLNSHNIMHVLVVAAVYSMHQATVRDLEWMSRVECHAAAARVLQTVAPALGNHTAAAL